MVPRAEPVTFSQTFSVRASSACKALGRSWTCTRRQERDRVREQGWARSREKVKRTRQWTERGTCERQRAGPAEGPQPVWSWDC